MSDAPLLDALKQYFGFDAFRLGQLEALRQVMAGRDSLIVMPTGAGKSLCFQLPALLHSGVTLVISPLIALMKDQVDALQANGIAATYINSSLEGIEQSVRLSGLASGRWKLCYIAPERLRNQSFREAAQRASISLLAVDEAHCISQWGHDFRPDYRIIGEFVEMLGRPPIAALTATATPQVQDDIERQLLLHQPFRQVTGFNRPNLRFETHFTPGDTLKQQALQGFLAQHPADACGVIYVGRRREAAEVAGFVRDVCGRSTVFYHGGLPPRERESVQNDWMAGRAGIVVATNAFGMGVDKPNVRFVVHYTAPGTLEAYYQEAGRAGRDGDPAHCLMLSDPADARLHEWFIDNDALDLDDLRHLYRHVRDEARRGGDLLVTTPAYLATVLQWRSDAKVRTGMKLLEQAGLTEDLGEQGGNGRWRVQAPSGRVDMVPLLRDLEERRTLKRGLLRLMMEYAQTHDCRRQFLLDYFGDPTPPVAAWCCDNCQRQGERVVLRVATAPEEKAPLWVLDAINHLSYGVGRVLLAKILAGSRGSGMDRYFEHPQFGILRHMGQKSVQALIDELIRERYLQISPGQYPTLALTSAGKQAAERRLGIPLSNGIGAQPAPSVRVVPEGRVNDTMEETRRLVEAGLGPQAIADERDLKISTVYNHLADLIRQGTVQVDQVVAEPIRTLIEAAVREVGTFYLSPIKARLPEDIDYGEIRCVVAAMQRAGVAVEATLPSNLEQTLVTRLMAWRTQTAQRLNQPPYFVFSNASIHAIAAAVPRDLAALDAVHGVGPHKCEAYGDALLAIVAEVMGGSAPPTLADASRVAYSSDIHHSD